LLATMVTMDQLSEARVLSVLHLMEELLHRLRSRIETHFTAAPTHSGTLAHIAKTIASIEHLVARAVNWNQYEMFELLRRVYWREVGLCFRKVNVLRASGVDCVQVSSDTDQLRRREKRDAVNLMRRFLEYVWEV
jgi:hypothetical protein